MWGWSAMQRTNPPAVSRKFQDFSNCVPMGFRPAAGRLAILGFRAPMRSDQEQMMRRQGRYAGERVRCIMTGIRDGVMSGDVIGKMRGIGCDRGGGSAPIVPDRIRRLEVICRMAPDGLAENKRIVARGRRPLCDPTEVHLPMRRIGNE